jgi:hypothetical protein
MAVRLSAWCASHPLPAGRFMVLISVRGWVSPRAIVWLEGLSQLKNPMTSSGLKPATFWLVVSASTNYTTSCNPMKPHFMFNLRCFFYLVFKLYSPNIMISLLNFLQRRFSSVQYSNILFTSEMNEDFTSHGHTVQHPYMYFTKIAGA